MIATATASRPIRYAVVGLGYIAQARALPAFAHARRTSTLAALVSDDAAKLRRLGRRYHAERTYSYAQFDECLASGIDAVYISLPNAQHAEFAIRALQAGVHVLTEKPMAVGVEPCERMIRAAEASGVFLMVAYRLHFEKAALKVLEVARSGKIGELRYVAATFGMQVATPNIRLQRELGGGALADLGIYCINAARTVFDAEPLSVYGVATHQGARFREVDEMTSAVLTFPGERTAVFTCSFNSAAVSRFELLGTKGRIQLEHAYDEDGTHELSVTQGTRTWKRSYATRDQFAPEFVAFSRCIQTQQPPEPSGREGLADVRVIAALQRSCATGQPVSLGSGRREHALVSPRQELRLRALRRAPTLVHARVPERS